MSKPVFTKLERETLLAEAATLVTVPGIAEQEDEAGNYPFADLAREAPKQLKALKAAVAKKDRAAVLTNASDLLFAIRAAFRDVRIHDFNTHLTNLARATARIGAEEKRDQETAED